MIACDPLSGAQEGFSIVFVVVFYRPAGWDSSKKIGILYENMHSVKPDQYYTDVIAKPMIRCGRYLNLLSFLLLSFLDKYVIVT